MLMHHPLHSIHQKRQSKKKKSANARIAHGTKVTRQLCIRMRMDVDNPEIKEKDNELVALAYHNNEKCQPPRPPIVQQILSTVCPQIARSQAHV